MGNIVNIADYRKPKESKPSLATGGGYGYGTEFTHSVNELLKNLELSAKESKKPFESLCNYPHPFKLPHETGSIYAGEYKKSADEFLKIYEVALKEQLYSPPKSLYSLPNHRFINHQQNLDHLQNIEFLKSYAKPFIEKGTLSAPSINETFD